MVLLSQFLGHPPISSRFRSHVPSDESRVSSAGKAFPSRKGVVVGAVRLLEQLANDFRKEKG